MKVLISPDSFKGSLSASEAAFRIERGISKVLTNAKLIKLPLSDGGEGLVDALVSAMGGQTLSAEVTGPLGGKVKAYWGLLEDGKTAVIEMASASGLPLVPEADRNPAITTTYGTGELIKTALQHGCQKLIVGIGGSATNDGGSGMVQALGAKLLDKNNEEISYGGKALSLLHKIDLTFLDPRFKDTEVLVACDVINPLTGPQGASQVYGPQKGANAGLIEELDQSLRNFARVIAQDLNVEVEEIPGAGAAGGLGAGLMAFLNAKLVPGIELVMEQVNFKEKLQDCDLVFTGEGKLDQQSVYGKVPVGVARWAHQSNVPVVVLAGEIADNLEFLHEEGITSCFSITNRPMTLEESITNAPLLIEKTAEEISRFWQSSKNLF